MGCLDPYLYFAIRREKNKNSIFGIGISYNLLPSRAVFGVLSSTPWRHRRRGKPRKRVTNALPNLELLLILTPKSITTRTTDEKCALFNCVWLLSVAPCNYSVVEYWEGEGEWEKKKLSWRFPMSGAPLAIPHRAALTWAVAARRAPAWSIPSRPVLTSGETSAAPSCEPFCFLLRVSRKSARERFVLGVAYHHLTAYLCDVMPRPAWQAMVHSPILCWDSSGIVLPASLPYRRIGCRIWLDNMEQQPVGILCVFTRLHSHGEHILCNASVPRCFTLVESQYVQMLCLNSFVFSEFDSILHISQFLMPQFLSWLEDRG